jgi:hypothetical protein
MYRRSRLDYVVEAGGAGEEVRGAEKLVGKTACPTLSESQSVFLKISRFNLLTVT